MAVLLEVEPARNAYDCVSFQNFELVVEVATTSVALFSVTGQSRGEAKVL